jgi:hypothetical protein
MSCSPVLNPVLSFLLAATIVFTLILFPFVAATKSSIEAREPTASNNVSAGNNIREVIPDRFQKRYQTWKQEYLDTRAGREQWERYARNRNFTLTIIVSAERGKGAGTDQYRWDESGQLIAATITLGDQIDEGYPSPFNYPVISSLAHTASSAPVSGSILAATKLAHEFGHVNWAAKTDGQLFKLQNKLIPVYNHILLSNGINVRDPKLVELAKQMRGTPVEIGQDRELWAETNALVYLRERCPDDETYGPMFKAIKSAVEEYAKQHIERFR